MCSVGNTSSDFSCFYNHWIAEQEAYLHRLLAASSNGREHEKRLLPLVGRVVEHYEEYYRAKAASARRDVLSIFSPNWISTTENLFQWIGGWQPRAAFHLVYSKQGNQLLERLQDILDDVHVGDLTDMSPVQLRQFDALQRRVIAMEREISEMAADVLSHIVDPTIVKLSHIITENKHPPGVQQNQGHHELPAERQMTEDIEKKKDEMLKVLEKADSLRMNTIRGVVDILHPMQAVHFLISAAEVHLRVHEFGLKHDQARLSHDSRSNVGISG